MIRAVLFDLDNTLIDFVKMKLTCCRVSIRAMIKAGLKMSEGEALKVLLEVYKPTYYEDSKIFQKFLNKVSGNIDYRVLSAGIAAYRQVVNGLLIPYPGVIKTLNALIQRGIKLGVVTDAPRLKAWIRLASSGLMDYFPIVVTLGDSKTRKPSAIPFNRALHELGLPASEVLFVGDSIDKDITGAKKLGMITALAQYGNFLNKKPNNEGETPHYVLNKFTDLLRIIEP